MLVEIKKAGNTSERCLISHKRTLPNPFKLDERYRLTAPPLRYGVLRDVRGTNGLAALAGRTVKLFERSSRDQGCCVVCTPCCMVGMLGKFAGVRSSSAGLVLNPSATRARVR